VKKIFTKKVLENGINVYLLPTDKFKTTNINVFIHQNLEEDLVTKTAFLPFILRRGSFKFPTTQQLMLHLDNLYGASFGIDVLKKGERHILQFRLDLVNSNFLPDNINLLKEGLDVLKEMILNPLTENGGFKREYFEQEKKVLKRHIQSLFDNKMQYAIERCFQEMCKEERFSLYKYGRLEDINDLDPSELYMYYKDMLSRNPIDIYVIGKLDEKQTYRLIQEKFGFERRSGEEIKPTLIDKDVEKVREVVEKHEVSQGKISLGLRTYTTYKDDDYYALLMASGVLGGGPHSKLFQNVREKASLAYYIFSKVEKFKGLMIISSGIEFKNYSKALDIIKKQLEDIKRGSITNQELEGTRKSIINSLKETADNPSALIGFYQDGAIVDKHETIEDFIEKISNVGVSDIRRASEKITLDTIYFLTRK